MAVYEFDFSYDDGKWELVNANIAGGLLNVALVPWTGGGGRYPDSNWGHGANDNFELEVNFRRKIIDSEPEISSWWTISIRLIDDILIQFEHETLSPNKLSIKVEGDEMVSKEQDMNDINWHSIKVRRVGTIYYLSVDDESEISYNYIIPKAIKSIRLGYKHSLPRENNGGEYDNFIYRWLKEQDYAFIM